MRKDTIGQTASAAVKIPDALESITLNSIRNIVSDELVEQTCQEVGYRFRRRKLTPVVTVLQMLLAALWPEESFNACWQVFWDTFVSWFPQFRGIPGRGIPNSLASAARVRHNSPQRNTPDEGVTHESCDFARGA